MLDKTVKKLDNTDFEKSATIYRDTEVTEKSVILYLHGGGLLYGNREDLPQLHVDTFTKAGYTIVALDYPLAPLAKLDVILEDVVNSINEYTKTTEHPLPYFLFGRSSGAYLCLLAASCSKLTSLPSGVLSYYGYGFLCDNWYQEPSTFYNKLPKVSEDCLNATPDVIHCNGDLDTHYSVYVYARQTGKWKDLIFEGRDKFFMLDYSLRTRETFPCPLFCAHSTGDTDVPFQEFLALCNRYNPKRFIASSKEHDFDRDAENPQTEKLLQECLAFLDKHLY